MPKPFPTPLARFAALASFPITPEERETLLAQFERLSLALDALDAFVGQEAEPATGFDPLLGGFSEGGTAPLPNLPPDLRGQSPRSNKSLGGEG